MPEFLGAPGDLPPPSTKQPTDSEKKKSSNNNKKGNTKDNNNDETDDAFALAASLLVFSPSPSSSTSKTSSLPSSIASPSWSRAHAIVEELNARAHADVAEGRSEEVVPVALARAVPLSTSKTATATSKTATKATATKAKTPLASVVEHLLVASAWRSRALPSILRSIEGKKGSEEEEEERGSSGSLLLRLYGLMRHDVSCANLLSVALSAPAPPPPPPRRAIGDGGGGGALDPRFSVSGPPALIRALCEEEGGGAGALLAASLAAWAARSVRWWEGPGGRGAARRTAEAAAAAQAEAASKKTKSSSSPSPSLAADETALAAASSALAVFRCLAQAAEDLPPSVGAVLSGAGAGDLVPVLLSLLDRPPWISQVGNRTFVLGGGGWELVQGPHKTGNDPLSSLLFPLPTAHAWLSLLHLCVGASFSNNSSSSSSSSSASFCALRSDERDWSPEGGGQALGSRIVHLLRKSPAALAAVPPLASALLPLAEAAAAGRGPGGTKKRIRRGGGSARSCAAAAAAACFSDGGGGSSEFFANASCPLVVEVVSKKTNHDEHQDIEAAIDGTDWEGVAAVCVERLLSKEKKREKKKKKKEEEEEKTDDADDVDGENEDEEEASEAAETGGLAAVVRALEGSSKLASLGNAIDADGDEDGSFSNKKNPFRVRVTAWATSSSSNNNNADAAAASLLSPSLLPPWTESFELEVADDEETSQPEEIDFPSSDSNSPKQKGIRRKLRLVSPSEGAATPPTLPPEGRLVASSVSSSSSSFSFSFSFSAAATYSLPACDLSLDIDSLPKSLWVTLGSYEGDEEKNDNGGGKSDDDNNSDGDGGGNNNSRNRRFALQLKLRRQPSGRATRRSRGEPWGCYAPCGGALTTAR